MPIRSLFDDDGKRILSPSELPLDSRFSTDSTSQTMGAAAGSFDSVNC
jgi:hypothetical protein